MKIGLLLCDHIAENFLEIGGDYPDYFARLFDRWQGAIEWRLYDLRNGDHPRSPRECDAWMTTGSRASAYDEEEWIERLKGFVRRIAAEGRPLVGICFGHQVMAEALGGEVRRAETGWGVGFQAIELAPGAASWMSPSESPISLLYLHQDQVSRLPAGSTLLGSSTHCPNAIYQAGERLLAIQAHPELTPPYLEAILHHRRELIGEDKFAAALSGLGSPTSAPLVAEWIINFIRSSPLR